MALAVCVATAVAAPLSVGGDRAQAAPTAEDLNREAAVALDMLYKTNPVAERIGKQSRAVLIFPNIVKAGLIFGGSYGEGVQLQNGRPVDYYNTASASWGLQAGAQSYGYALFLMNDKAMDYLKTSNGWEIGVGPTVVLVNEGVAANLSTTTLMDDVYGVVFDQRGLMAGISLEGSKISRIRR
jgi:lipid-binding SYLF domain-containing protein